MDDLQFIPCRIRPWHGRYARIPGEESVFHIRTVDGRPLPVIVWRLEGYVGTCRAIENRAVGELTRAVMSAKRMLGGPGGGSFQINEFGQVIVPASDASGRRMIVGEIEGKLLFENPFEDDSIIDIADDTPYCCGDKCFLPYVGVPYNLSKRGRIYFYRMDDEGSRAEYPRVQDRELIRLLRSVRSWGGVRFIVNPYGLILTKKPLAGEWQPDEKWGQVFVSKINLERWFEKED